MLQSAVGKDVLHTLKARGLWEIFWTADKSPTKKKEEKEKEENILGNLRGGFFFPASRMAVDRLPRGQRQLRVQLAHVKTHTHTHTGHLWSCDCRCFKGLPTNVTSDKLIPGDQD